MKKDKAAVALFLFLFIGMSVFSSSILALEERYVDKKVKKMDKALRTIKVLNIGKRSVLERKHHTPSVENSMYRRVVKSY